MTRELAVPVEVVSGACEPTIETPFAMDEERFRDLYTRTARPLRAYLSRVSGDPTLADDFLQEAYFRFLRAKLPEMDEAGQKNYLFRIATNLVNDHFRSSKRAHPVIPEKPIGERTDDAIHLRADMARVFGDLKPRERQLLWLAYVEGATHKEIAEVVGLKAASIRLLLFRARRTVAKMLRERGLDTEFGDKP